MRITDLEIVRESVNLDDLALLQRFYKLRNSIKQKEEMFRKSRECFNENDYLSLAVARLAYSFAKEEFEALYDEIEKRGLITN